MLAVTLFASGYRVADKALHHTQHHRIVATKGGERGVEHAIVATAPPVPRQPYTRPPLELLAPVTRSDGPDACCGVPKRRKWIVSGGHGRHGAG